MREEGHYWVTLGDELEVALWRDGAWWMIGGETSLPDKGVQVLGARIAPPPGKVDDLSAEARSILECEGAWNGAGGLELVQSGLAVPTQIELTAEGTEFARVLRACDETATPGV